MTNFEFERENNQLVKGLTEETIREEFGVMREYFDETSETLYNEELGYCEFGEFKYCGWCIFEGKENCHELVGKWLDAER